MQVCAYPMFSEIPACSAYKLLAGIFWQVMYLHCTIYVFCSTI